MSLVLVIVILSIVEFVSVLILVLALVSCTAMVTAVSMHACDDGVYVTLQWVIKHGDS